MNVQHPTVNVQRSNEQVAALRERSSLARPVEMLEGVGPTRAKVLRMLGVKTMGDLLEYFPARYQFESAERQVGALVREQIQTARGTVIAVDYIPVRPRPRFEATIQDDTGTMGLVWFHGAWLRGKIFPGLVIRVQGKVRLRGNMPQMVNPKWELIEQDAQRIEDAKFRAIYPATARLPTDSIERIVADNLDDALPGVEEWFTDEFLSKRHLLPRRDA